MATSKDWKFDLLTDKLKGVSTEALEATVAEAIAKLIDESPDKILVSIGRIHYAIDQGIFARAEIELTVYDHHDFSSTKTDVDPETARAEALVNAGDSELLRAERVSTRESRGPLVEETLKRYRAALAIYTEDRFPKERQAVAEKIARAEKLLK